MSGLRVLLLSLLMMVVISRSMPLLTAGRWSKGLLPPNVDRWVKNKHPELQGSRAIDIQSRVLNGVNYKITYEGPVKAIVEVSYKSWNNAFKETGYTRF